MFFELLKGRIEMTLDKVYSLVNSLLPELEYLGSTVHVDSNVEFDRNNPDEVQAYRELVWIMSKLYNVFDRLTWFHKPVTSAYELTYNSDSDRYECDYHEFHCGDGIEFMYYNDDQECYEWRCSRIEHNGDHYYIYGYGDVSLDGLKVRFRY